MCSHRTHEKQKQRLPIYTYLRTPVEQRHS